MFHVGPGYPAKRNIAISTQMIIVCRIWVKHYAESAIDIYSLIHVIT